MIAPLAFIMGVIVGVVVLPKLIGFAPYGEGAMVEQIEQEYSAVCEKFGFSIGSPQYGACKLDLAELHKQHRYLLAACSWE